MDLSMTAIAMTLSWLVWILTVVPVLRYFSLFLLCSVFFLNTEIYIYYRSVSCVLFLSLRIGLQSNGASHPFRFLFEDFRLCSRYKNVNYGAWMFSNLCFVLLLRLVGSLVPISINEKKLKRSPGKGRTWYNLEDGVTALARLYALFTDRARCFSQLRRALYPNLIIRLIKIASK